MSLVSIVIPCYNAERWVGEAIESALKQTHAPVEVVVIDDGSTDESRNILESFGDKIRWQSLPHRGGNSARNAGFAVSSGTYVQFLDADDYLLPTKIQHQVEFLESSGLDGVYGDWRHQHHEKNGHVWLEDVVVAGEKDDVLEALLRGWWVAPCALLWRRVMIENISGWDERLSAAQDRDFFIAVAIAGGNVGYQPGCKSIYRRHGNVTVSTSNQRRWLDGHKLTLDKAWHSLKLAGRLTDKYRMGLARSYFSLARNYFDLDKEQYALCMHQVFTLDKAFRPSESGIYNLTQRLLGYALAERLASWKRNRCQSNSSD